MTTMTKDQIKAVLDRVLTWPPERQADVAQVVTLMEEQDKSALRLSDEQLAEVRRRLADPNPKFLTLEEVRERFARRRARGLSSVRSFITTLIGSMHGSRRIGRARRIRCSNAFSKASSASASCRTWAISAGGR